MQYQPRTGIASAHWLSGTEGIKGESINREGTKRESMKCEGKQGKALASTEKWERHMGEGLETEFARRTLERRLNAT